MLVVGLTGGIATGKSTVSNILKSKQLPVVDADVLAREVVAPGTPGLKKIVKSFGQDILVPDGSLDRKKLGSIIFNDPEKRKILNSIVHPAVRRALLKGVLSAWIRGERICILDVPLLIEGPMWKLVGTVVVVHCPEDAQLERLMKRDGSTREDALSRLKSQLPIAEKVRYADIVIENSGSREELEKNVELFLQEVQSSVGWTWRLKWLIPPLGIMAAAWTLLQRWRRRLFEDGGKFKKQD